MNSITDSDNYTVTYLYDALDRRVRTTYPDGTYEQTIYSRLDAEWVRDRAGRWTHTVHHANREVESVTDPAGRRTRFERCDGCGALEGIVDAEGHRTSFAFDYAGRLTRKIYADNTELQYEYEPETSRLWKMTDAKQQVTRYAYHVDNTLAAVSYENTLGQALVPPTAGVSYQYDDDYKRLKAMTDQFGVTEFAYWPVGVNGAGRLRFEDGPEGPNNEAATALDVDKIVHTYDEYGRELSSALNGVGEARTYDALGRVGTVVNALGTFTYSYASAVSGRVAQVSYPGGHKAEYGYHPKIAVGPPYVGDGDFRLWQIKNTRNQNSGGSSSSSYGSGGSSSSGSGSSSSYGSGGSSSSSYASVASLYQYDYDRAGNIVNWYQSGSDMSGLTGKAWQMGYDAADELTGAAVKTAYIYGTPHYGSTVEQQYGYGYDGAGNRVTEQSAVQQGNGSNAVTLTGSAHNELNQMTGRTGGSGAMIFEGTVNEAATVSVGGQPAQVWGIGNGQYGFRGSAPVNAGANSVPIVARDPSYTGATAQNIAEHQTTRYAQVQATGIAIPSLEYDDNGNLKRENRADGSERTFSWDAVNRLVKVIDGATTTEWKYSGRGQRMEERVNGVLVAKWRWDGLQMKEMIAGTTLRRYYGMGMQWTANTAQPTVTVNYFFFRDHLGSLREMIDANGNLAKRYAYDLWGRRTQTLNATAAPEPMLGFTGHFYHANTGLHLAFYRAYSAELGRWLSKDPVGEEGGTNLYDYAENNGVGLIDPDGNLAFIPLVIAGTVGGAALGAGWAWATNSDIAGGAWTGAVGGFAATAFIPFVGELGAAAFGGGLSGGLGGALGAIENGGSSGNIAASSLIGAGLGAASGGWLGSKFGPLAGNWAGMISGTLVDWGSVLTSPRKNRNHPLAGGGGQGLNGGPYDKHRNKKRNPRICDSGIRRSSFGQPNYPDWFNSSWQTYPGQNGY